MYKPESIYTKIALQAIISYLKEGVIITTVDEMLPEELKEKKACFVTIHTNEGNLRGCIGTLSPHHDSLFEEIIQNSISAATKDIRFEPLTVEEIDDISLSVSVLSDPFPIESFSELNPEKYGVIVRLNSITKAVLLPNIKGIDTVEDQIYKLKKKGGVEEIDDEFLQYFAFTTKEYK